VDVDGARLRLSNLDKVYWPAEGITKGDLVAYYWNVAATILPHLRDRPLTLKRMPGGVDGGHFFQKAVPGHAPATMPRCAAGQETGIEEEALLVAGAADLLFVVGLGCIDFHPRHARCATPQHPDYLVFDLDPFPPAGFAETLAVARHVHAALDTLGLRGYPKTSGATGLHVYVPLRPDFGHDQARGLAGRLARLIAEADPGRVTLEWALGRRPGGVFIDHNMNRRGASLAAVYSVRPEPGATVSMPLTWAEVEAGDVRPEMFTMTSALARLAEEGDLFLPVVTEPQDLGPALQRMGVS
jgi:bifunctional non-homologous end joining protein LigD